MRAWMSDVFTLGFARRAAAYKRADLLFTDIERLKAFAAQGGGLQIVYAGKAHPQDNSGKELIQRIYRAKEALRDEYQDRLSGKLQYGDRQLDDRAVSISGSIRRNRRWKLREPAA